MKRFKLVCGIFLISFAVLMAQQDSIIKLSLSEAIESALQNNTDMQNAKLDIKKAERIVWETTAMGLPQVSGSLSYSNIVGDIPEFSFGPGPAMVIAQKSSVTYGATLSQLVFSGEYIVGLQASKTFMQLSKNSLEKTILDTKENIATSYFLILTLENSVKLLDSSANNLQVTLKEMKAMNETGFVEDTDVDQIQLALNTIENAKKSINRQVDISYQLLKISLGLDDQQSIVLKDSKEMVMSSLNIINTPDLDFQIGNNIDYKSLQTMERIDELSLRREQTKYLPSVFAFYNYQDKTNPPDIDFTINQMVGVNIDIPIFSSGMKNAKVKQARIELEKTRNSKSNTEKLLKMQSNELYNSYFNAMDKYETGIKNVELSKRIYEKALIKYKEGMISSLVLTQANDQYINAESSLTQTTMELYTSRIAIEKILGTL